MEQPNDSKIVNAEELSTLCWNIVCCVCSGSQTFYFVFVLHNRHFGDVCHVFECVHQSARSLVATLHDVIVTSLDETTESTTSLQQKENNGRHTNGGDTIEKVADDHNSNSIFVSMYMRINSACYWWKIYRFSKQVVNLLFRKLKQISLFFTIHKTQAIHNAYIPRSSSTAEKPRDAQC